MNLQSAAQKRPRSVRDFEARTIALATTNPFSAGLCLSVLVTEGTAGRPRYISRISLMMAEIIAISYDNLRVESALVGDTPRTITARGVAHDLESDFTAFANVIEPAVTSDGVPLDGRKRAHATSLAIAKARRAAIVKAAPTTVCRAVETACVEMLFADEDARAASLARITAWLDASGIRQERVWRALGIAGRDDLDSCHIAILIALRTAIGDGDSTLDEAFPEDAQSIHARPPRFVPPIDAAAPSAVTDPRPSAAARLARLIEACRMSPKAILDYLRAKGHGTYLSLGAAPDSILTAVVCAWPDVVAEIAGGTN